MWIIPWGFQFDIGTKLQHEMKERRGKASNKKSEFGSPENHYLPTQHYQSEEVYAGGAAFALFSWAAGLGGKRQDPGSFPISADLPDFCLASVTTAGGSRIPRCNCNGNPYLYLLIGKTNLFHSKYSKSTHHRAEQTQIVNLQKSMPCTQQGKYLNL